MTTAARQPLDPPLVYRAYVHEVDQHGRRGAYRRTAEKYACSPERVRQIVAKHAPPPEPEADLRYIAPPFALPEPQARPQTDDLLCRLIMSPLVQPASAVWQEPQAPTFRAAAASTYRLPNRRALIPHDFHADAHNAVWWSRMVSWMVVVWWCSGLLARQDWRLSALTLIPVFFWWHVAASCGRDARRLGR